MSPTETEGEVRQLYMAAHACPTRSVHPPANDWRPGSDPYPMPLDEAGTVLLCGHRMRALARRAATYPEQPVDYGKVRY